ncbi:hypothetical protein BDP55DRAFT_28790 [Colletotrichum godetiae]|uniref:Uncharacterized protein n=1 Tax=Colletotrichum godetiae TaxID=1209918 RepID=A0AAJ0AQY5_9PEZI|nr:uncharacterized protein BDP55DRAFT_28790 [Colletotrichum godetiae]KAK1688739.1 hypothetical protein BDP55DRAFT_28790 [Colletotrichum godetiae]
MSIAPQTMPLPLPRISSPTDTDTRSYASPASSQPSRIPARPARQRTQLSNLETFPAAPLNCRSIPTAVTGFSLASSQCSPTFKFHSVGKSVKITHLHCYTIFHTFHPKLYSLSVDQVWMPRRRPV